MLVVISGLPGTGKTAVASVVAKQLDAVHLSIDPVEDALLGAGLPPGREVGVGAYEAVRVIAEAALARGRTAVVDAVNDSEAARDTWRTAASSAAVPLRFFLLKLGDDDEHRRRLGDRTRGFAHLPEPTWSDIVDLTSRFEPWAGRVEIVNAEPSVSVVVRDILARLDL